MKTSLDAVLSAVILLATACTGASTAPPVGQPPGATATTTPPVGQPPGATVTPWPPSATLATNSDGTTCLVAAPEPTASIRDLPDAPLRADLLWYAGSECRTWLTSLDGAQASALVADLKRLPPWPTGAYNCPRDDGRFVQIWFYTDQSAPSVRIRLAGCAFGAPSNLADLGAWPDGMPGGPT